MGKETVEQLKRELSDARRRISELGKSLYECNHMEEAIRGSEERYRNLVENAHDVVWVFDLNLGYTYVSPSVKRLRGYSVEEAMKQKLDEVLTPESARKALELFERERLLEIGGHHHGPDWSFTTEFEMIRKDGSTFWTEMTMNPLYDEAGRIKDIMGITRDISERKQAEEELRKHRDRLEELVKERTSELIKANEQLKKEIAERKEAEDRLRESEEKYRIYFSLSNDVMLSYDKQFRVQSVTPNVERNLGYKPEELVDKTFLDLNVLHPDCMKEAINNALKVLSGETVYSSVYEFVTKDGSRKYGEVSGVPLVRDNNVVGEITVARDITERTTLQKTLQENEERYRITLQSMPDAVSIVSADDSRYIYINDAFCKNTGYSLEDTVGKTPFELNLPAAPEDIEQCTELLKNKEPIDNIEHRCRRKDGVILDTIISARPVHYGGEDCMVMVMTDITALKRIEEEKKRLDIKSQKMEAIGTLSKGIAHDFNNILTSIIGYTKMSMKDFMAIKKEDKDLSVVRSDLNEVRNAAYRARDLVNHILAFSRHPEKKYSPIVLSSTIKESLKLLQPSLPANIRIRENLMGPQVILGDPAQIHLIMTNLLTNAAYAMDKTGGELDVNLQSVLVDDAAALDLDVTAGQYMKLTVRDTGHGISPEVMARVFDPYFTTKWKSQGTGLGLSIVHGIVVNHGGAVNCTSTPGQGTTFDIYLPQYDFKEEEIPAKEQREVINGDMRFLNLDKDLPLVALKKKTDGKRIPGKDKEH